MRASPACVALIKRFEGLRLVAYRCPAGRWTVGYGHTDDVGPGQRITEHQADVILQSDLERYEEGVDTLGISLTQGQFDALVAFAFNLGLTTLANSTLLRRLRAGDVEGAAGEFGRWVRAAGVVLPGLVARRAAERALFES